MEIVKENNNKKTSLFFQNMSSSLKLPPSSIIQEQTVFSEQLEISNSNSENHHEQKNDVNVSSESERELQGSLTTIDKINKFLKNSAKESSSTIKNFNNHSVSYCIISKTNSSILSENTTTINSLPMEILCKIMDHLEFNDLKNASLCCKKWRNTFMENYYLKDILIKANNNLFLSERPLSSTSPSLTNSKHRTASNMALSVYSSSSTFNSCLYRNCFNLEFDHDSADVTLLLKNLRANTHSDEQLLPKLRHLKFKKTMVSSKSLIELFDEVPKLQSLKIVECDSLFMSGFTSANIRDKLFSLSNLTELSLSKNRYLTDFLINILINSAPNLITLDISYCNLTQSNYKSISNSINISNKNGSIVVLTIENLINQFQKYNKIKSLDLSGIELFNHEHNLLNLIEPLQYLEEILLCNLNNLKVETLCKLIRIRPNLKSINLNGSIQIDDLRQKSIESILETSIHVHEEMKSYLQIVKISKSRINDHELFVQQIGFLLNLTYLDLSSMTFQRSFGNKEKLNAYITNFATNLSNCERLKYLILAYCDFLVNDSFIKLVCRKLKNLKHLDLRNCNQITNTSLHYISNYFSELNYLDISMCRNISDYGIDSSLTDSTDKQLFNELNANLNGPSFQIRKYNEQPFLLIKTKNEIFNSNIKNQKNENMPDTELKSNLSFRFLKKLKTLKMDSCVNITDFGLMKGVNLENLKELKIKLCTNVNGEFINGLIKDNNRFKIENYNDFKLDSNSFNLFTNLKVLNLNQCVMFKEENLMIIIENSPNLRELSISAIQSVSNEVIELLLRNKKLLTLLDVSFCPNLNESSVEKYEQFLSIEFCSRDFHIDKRFISK